MSDDLVVASLGPEHFGLHLPMKREYRDKGEHQSNGQFNSSTVPVRFRSRAASPSDERSLAGLNKTDK